MDRIQLSEEQQAAARGLGMSEEEYAAYAATESAPTTSVLSLTPFPKTDWILVREGTSRDEAFVAPQKFRATIKPHGLPRVKLSIEIKDSGVPVCHGLAIVDQRGAISKGLLGTIPLPQLLNLAVAAASQKVERGPGDEIERMPITAADERYILETAPPSRRLGAELPARDLKKLAEVYSSNPRTPRQAVREHFEAKRRRNLSLAMINRWIKQARRGGYL